MDNLDYFPIKLKKPKFISAGSSGEVYQITRKHVGKFLWGTESSLDYFILKKENEICKSAYAKGLSVPKPEGVFIVSHPKSKMNLSSFVMEYVKGQTLGEIMVNLGKSSLYEKVLDLLKKEIEKALDLGFSPVDFDTGGNVIWCPKKEKIYLIDFECWEEKNNGEK